MRVAHVGKLIKDKKKRKIYLKEMCRLKDAYERWIKQVIKGINAKGRMTEGILRAVNK